MAPATKIQDLQAISLQLVKPTSKVVNLTPASDDGDTASRAASMELLYQLLLLIGENMSKLAQANNQTQMDQTTIAKLQAKATQETATEQVKKLQDYVHQLQEEAKWGPLFTFFKWLGVALGALVSVISCGTAAGVVVALTVVALCASPLFNMAIGGIASSLESDGCDSGAAKIIADVIMTVIVAVVSLGTEALAGLAQAASKAADSAVEVGAEAGSKIVYRTAASTEAITQALISSNLIGDALDEIPGLKKKAPWLAELISVLVQIAALIAAGKSTAGSDGASFFQKLTKLTPETLQKIVPTLLVTSSLVQGGSGAGQGAMAIQESEIRRAMAPLQAQLMFEEGFMQLITQMTSQSQKTIQSSINSYEKIFDIDFSRDMRACVTAQYQG